MDNICKMDSNRYPILASDSCEQKVVDKILQRSEERVVEMEKKRLVKQDRLTAKEQSEYFSSVFNASKQEIQSKLSQSWEIDKAFLICHFDGIIKDLQKMQKLLSDSIMFLPAYEIKVAQKSLKLLLDEIQETQNTLLPKKKFVFRNKTKKCSIVSDPVTSIKENGISSVLEPLQSSIRNISDATINKYNEDVDAKDIGLHLLQNCKVYLYGAPSTLFISGLSNCQVFSGPVSTSVYIENCNDCTFVIACQQLRVHATTVCIFYAHVSSRSIMEDSSSLKFAPYKWTYSGQDKDFVRSGLDREKNNWNLIDDFNWLVSDIPSPNWSVLPEDQYVLLT